MRLYQFMGWVAAFLFAAWAFAILWLLGTFFLAPVSLTVVLAHALGLGFPIFLIFWWKRWVNPITCACGGFLVAAASGVVPNWPGGPKGANWSIGVPHVVDGAPTLAGWLHFLQILTFLGFVGALAGLVFWAVLLASGALAPESGADRSQRRAAMVLGVAAVLLTGAFLAIPDTTLGRIVARAVEDRTCHNVLRDRDTISPQMRMHLDVPAAEAPKLTQAMRDFAARHEMSFRDAGTPASLFLSLCTDRGVTIQIQSLAAISVFELKPGSGWRRTAKELIDRIESLWPGKLRYRAHP